MFFRNEKEIKGIRIKKRGSKTVIICRWYLYGTPTISRQVIRITGEVRKISGDKI